MTEELSLQEIQKRWHGTFRSYTIGFVASLLLTSASFLLVATRFISNQLLIFFVISFSLAQFIFQLFYFLHIGQTKKPRWKLLVFYFMVLMLLIVAIGSLWIMHDLNVRVMTHD